MPRPTGWRRRFIIHAIEYVVVLERDGKEFLDESFLKIEHDSQVLFVGHRVEKIRWVAPWLGKLAHKTLREA